MLFREGSFNVVDILHDVQSAWRSLLYTASSRSVLHMQTEAVSGWLFNVVFLRLYHFRHSARNKPWKTAAI